MTDPSKNPRDPILLVDDDPMFLRSMRLALTTAGLSNLQSCSESRDVLAMMGRTEYALVILDLLMPEVSGQQLLPRLVESYPQVPVIVITAVNDAETAVQSLRNGAFDYLVKPINTQLLADRINHALQYRDIRDENRRLRDYLLNDKLEHPEAFEKIITSDAKMRSIFKYIESVAPTPLPILVTGETGVGKELIAESIHAASDRKGPFVPVNIAGLDDQMFTDTLFGHEAGSYTGAIGARKGLVEKATGGTLFLDEIGDIDLRSQVKLLRLIQEKTYYPIGSDREKSMDARIVCSTNQDLRQMVADGRFRKDLYYRLDTCHLRIPPLRERKADITFLLEHFIRKAARILNKKTPAFPRELTILLQNHAFHGNIRELEGLVYHAVSNHTGGVLSMRWFIEKIHPDGQDFREPVESETIEPGELPKFGFPETFTSLKEMNKMLIDEALRRSKGNQTIAAKLIGLSRKALNKRLNRMDDDPADDGD